MTARAHPCRSPRRSPQRGLTLLEVIIVIAIVGVMTVMLRTGFRALSNADLHEDTTEFVAYVRRASQLAIEHGEQHRIVLDLDSGKYMVEICQGQATLARNKEQLRVEEDKVKQAVERGTERLRDLPADALAAGDPDEATRRAVAIAGHHIADRMCAPVAGGVTGDVSGKGWERQLTRSVGVRFKEVWVQHKDASTTKGQVAIYFYPNGSAEKAVIELADGDSIATVLVHGLTGWVQQKTGKLDDVDTHMLRDALGKREAQREIQ